MIEQMKVKFGDEDPRKLAFNSSDTIKVIAVDRDASGNRDGRWTGEKDSSGNYIVGIGDVEQRAAGLLGRMRDDSEMIVKVILQVIIAAAISLFKDNHHWTPDLAAKLSKIMDGGGAAPQLRSLGIITTREATSLGLHRTLVHPVTMSDKWKVAEHFLIVASQS